MFYWLMKMLVGPVLRAYFRPWARGVENIPEGGVIIASNHLAVIDSFLLPLTISRKIRFIGKAEYFSGKGITGRVNA